MAVQSSSEIRIATALFPVLSLLNHSCSPNTSISFTGGFQTDPLSQFGCSEGHTDHPESSHCGVTVTVRASKDLTAGQEILHCYGKTCEFHFSLVGWFDLIFFFKFRKFLHRPTL